MNFGKTDKTDFLILPFAFFYFYILFGNRQQLFKIKFVYSVADSSRKPQRIHSSLFQILSAVYLTAAFKSSPIGTQEIFHSEVIPWVGVLFCLIGLLLLLWSLISFGQSFRVGIDTDHPAKLITTDVFAFSRNPIYVAFTFIVLGQFLVFLNWILLIYMGAAIWLFHHQVLREEEYLRQHYGSEYVNYCNQVRRYL